MTWVYSSQMVSDSEKVDLLESIWFAMTPVYLELWLETDSRYLTRVKWNQEKLTPFFYSSQKKESIWLEFTRIFDSNKKIDLIFLLDPITRVNLTRFVHSIWLDFDSKYVESIESNWLEFNSSCSSLTRVSKFLTRLALDSTRVTRVMTRLITDIYIYISRWSRERPPHNAKACDHLFRYI